MSLKKGAIVFLLCLSMVAVQAQGIEIPALSLKEGIATAAKENKILFIDMSTSWCGICKVMEKKVFTEPEVRSFITGNFVLAHADPEIEADAMKLAIQYGVKSYPTYLFINPGGTLNYISTGYQTPVDFLATLQKAVNPQSAIAHKGYNTQNVKYPDFYLNKFQLERKSQQDVDAKIITGFLDKSTDLFAPHAWAVISVFPLNEKYNHFFLSNFEKYKSLYGNAAEKKAEDLLEEKAISITDVDIIPKIKPWLDSIPKVMSGNFLSTQLQVLSYYSERDPKILAVALEYIQKSYLRFPQTAVNKLISIASFDGMLQSHLNTISKMSNELVQKMPDYDGANLLQAVTLFKQGKKKEGKIYWDKFLPLNEKAKGRLWQFDAERWRKKLAESL